MKSYQLLLGLCLILCLMYGLRQGMLSAVMSIFKTDEQSVMCMDSGGDSRKNVNGRTQSRSLGGHSLSGKDKKSEVDRLFDVIESSDDTRGRTWDQTQATRTERVQQACDYLSPTVDRSELLDRLKNRASDNIIVDHKHKVLFCTIPKAACSTWRTMLMRLTGHSFSGVDKIHIAEERKKSGLDVPRMMSRANLSAVLDQYTSIMLVRHPLVRLLSAYREKFQHYNKWTIPQYQMTYGRQIIARYRGDTATEKSKQMGHDVTFHEFARFITDEHLPRANRSDEHWRSYQDLCHPCQIRYDHVLKFETFDMDGEAVLRKYFNVRDSINNDATTTLFPKKNMNTGSSQNLTSSAYAELPQSLVTTLAMTYWPDMAMFGYTP